MNWLNYNISQQTYSPKTFSDVSTNKFNKIHERLFEDAKHKAIIKSKLDNDNYIFERKYDLKKYFKLWFFRTKNIKKINELFYIPTKFTSKHKLIRMKKEMKAKI